MGEFNEIGCKLGSWLMERLFPKKKVFRMKTKSNICFNDFISESWIWLHNISSGVSPCTHMTSVPDLCSRMVAYILDDISLDVDHLVVSKRDDFKDQSGTHIFFPSLITIRECGL